MHLFAGHPFLPFARNAALASRVEHIAVPRILFATLNVALHIEGVGAHAHVT